jgi:putative transposase
VKDICATYLRTSTAAADGERVICLDEMTGIQALERKAPDLPMRRGKIRWREFEYIRHGTQSLIASFDVASGQVIAASVGQTRTEADYLAHVQQTLATDPLAKKWHLTMDCLNIHQSESLVRCIAEREGLDIELGDERQKRHSPIDGNSDGVPYRPHPSGCVPLHPKALLLAQPD